MQLEPVVAHEAYRPGAVGHDYSHECLHMQPDSRLDPEAGAAAIHKAAKYVVNVLEDFHAYVSELRGEEWGLLPTEGGVASPRWLLQMSWERGRWHRLLLQEHGRLATRKLLIHYYHRYKASRWVGEWVRIRGVLSVTRTSCSIRTPPHPGM
jgi:hypothetical protein